MLRTPAATQLAPSQHPPKIRSYAKKLNRKEQILALNSAIAATSQKEIVEARGHNINGIELPLIVEDKIEAITKTRDFVALVRSLGLTAEMDSSKKKKLLVIVGTDNGIRRAASNVDGVDVATVNDLDVDLLAPGTHPGRLTLWSESAIKNIS